MFYSEVNCNIAYAKPTFSGLSKTLFIIPRSVHKELRVISWIRMYTVRALYNMYNVHSKILGICYYSVLTFQIDFFSGDVKKSGSLVGTCNKKF